MGRVSHSFLVIPDCPYPLLGRDLLTKVGAQIHFTPEGTTVKDKEGNPLQILTVKLEDEYRLFEIPTRGTNNLDWWLQKCPQAWAETASMGEAKSQAPVHIEIKSQATPVMVRQYPMSLEDREEIRSHILRLLDLGVL